MNNFFEIQEAEMNAVKGGKTVVDTFVTSGSNPDGSCVEDVSTAYSDDTCSYEAVIVAC